MTQWHVVIGTGLFALWLFLFLDLILKTKTLQTVISERKTFFAMWTSFTHVYFVSEFKDTCTSEDGGDSSFGAPKIYFEILF